MITKQDIEQLKPYQARNIIESLRKGIVPSEYVAFFTVGRQNWIRFVEEDFDDYIAQGGSKVRFINGDYGDGKTHFMSILHHLAKEKQFGTSFVVLTRDVPIHKFEIIYQEIVTQLKGEFVGQGLRMLLHSWIEKQKALLQSKDEPESEITLLSDQLRHMPGMDLNFANALIAILRIECLPISETDLKRDPETDREVLYQWFEGRKVAKKDLKSFSVFEILNKTNSKQFLNSLITFLRWTGHNGLILLFDELETVLAHSTSIRNAAYENIRLLMDNTDFSHYLHIFFSIIPDVLRAEKGFKSYDALWSRVRTAGDSEALNYRGTQIDLHRTPLNVEELIDLGVALRRIHELSYRWNAADMMPDDRILKMCEAQREMGVISEVRLFIKQMIRYLDMGEQGVSDMPDITANLVMSQKENEIEKTRQLEPVWDQ